MYFLECLKWKTLLRIKKIYKCESRHCKRCGAKRICEYLVGGITNERT